MKLDPVPARAAAYVALYPRLLQIARNHGYALCAHGSFHRDMDLVAIPWIESASSPVELIRHIKKAVKAVTHHEDGDRHFKDCNPTKKPHGRMSYSLHFTNSGMYGGYLDISVMPKLRTRTARKPAKKSRA